MITKILKSTLAITALFVMASCSPFQSDSLSAICESEPQLCDDLHQISDCRYKRTTLIRARYYDKIEPNEAHTRDLLTQLDNYESCLELTLFLQFTRHKERKKLRMENYLTAQKLMEEKLKESKGTQDPHLAYYLWTRHQDLNAKTVFLNAANKKDLTDIRLLTKLATIYSKEDPQRAIDLFYKALRESKSVDALPKNIFTLMMTIFYQNKEFEQAYIWALIAKEESTEKELPINLDLILQKGLINGTKVILNEDALEEQAEVYHNQLTDGIFNSDAPQFQRID
ncbi:MAG: hypothetical protein ACJAT7_001512 [Psychromonas sp.]|jgi:hypothetical protein|uniref:DUF2989 domain-containing protein n=1 Tax=Psychromonas sp. TaxID=1884585 RepID=UPI0039E5D73C